MKTWEIYCEHFSRIIQNNDIIFAITEFEKQYPEENIILIEDVEFKKKAYDEERK